jgi:hypothetical protein
LSVITVPKAFFRFSGWMLLLAGIIIAVVQFIHLEDVPANLSEMSYFVEVAVWSHVALFVAVTMLLMGLPGLYLRQAAGLKWWGWVSFVLIFVVFMFDTTHAVLQIYEYPVLFDNIQSEEKLKEVSDLVMSIQRSEGWPGFYMMKLLFPVMLIAIPLMGLSMLRAGILSKWPAILHIVFLVLLFVPFEPMMHYVFPLSFLVYAWYGAILAFEGTPLKHNQAPSMHA